jgi:CheY-like chemotaxis protein
MKRLFLIDDDEIINHVHSMVIKRIDPTVKLTLFKSGVQFVEAINQESNFEFPDIIFLDIRMPELSGFDVLDVLLENHQGSLKNTAIFVLSSTLDDRDLNKAVSYPIVTKFMSKPLTFEMVSELLSK